MAACGYGSSQFWGEACCWPATWTVTDAQDGSVQHVCSEHLTWRLFTPGRYYRVKGRD